MRPDFSLIWGADNAPFTPIEASDYTAGWVFRTGAPPRRVNFDYFQNLSDQRAAWLGEQMLLAVGHEWQDDVSYDAYAVVRSPVNGQLYRSLVGGNLGNEPSVSGSEWAIGVVEQQTALPPLYKSGFVALSNSGAPTTSIDVGPGSCRDFANTVNIALGSTITGIIQTSGSWAAGPGQNKLLSGARAINTTYHLFVIYKDSDGSADIGASTLLDPTAQLPVGYSKYRRIASFVTLSSGLIKQFEYINDECLFQPPLRDINVTGAATGTILYTIGVPTGLRVRAIIQGYASSTAGSAAIHINTPGFNDVAGNVCPTAQMVGTSAGSFGRVYIYTNTSAQIQVNSNLADNTYSLGTYGFVDNWSA